MMNPHWCSSSAGGVLFQWLSLAFRVSSSVSVEDVFQDRGDVTMTTTAETCPTNHHTAVSFSRYVYFSMSVSLSLYVSVWFSLCFLASHLLTRRNLGLTENLRH